MTLNALWSLFLVVGVAALAPIVSRLVPGRPPQVLFLIAGGVVIGPQGLGAAESVNVSLIASLGLGFLFLLAGYELDPRLLRQRQGRLALRSWLVSAVLAVTVVGVLARTGFVHAYVPVAIALTTTALGTLLPILRDNDMLTGRLGGYVFAAGAVGEMLPILAIALFLGAYKSVWEAAVIVGIAGLAYLLTWLPRRLADTRVAAIIADTRHSTSQSTLRLTLVLLVGLLLITERFGIDAALGAFFAGMVLRRNAPADPTVFDEKLDTMGYGLFIPVFFVSSGMNLDVRSIIDDPLRLLTFFALLLAVRGVPALLVYRKALVMRERLELMLLTATTLPLLVALTEIGLQSGTMLPQNAAALVGAGVLSVAVFPVLAVRMHRREPASEAREPAA